MQKETITVEYELEIYTEDDIDTHDVIVEMYAEFSHPDGKIEIVEERIIE